MASADVLPIHSHDSTHDPAFSHVDPITTNSLKRKRAAKPPPTPILEMGNENSPKLDFDPAKHLNYSPPAKVWTMEDIGKGDQGISPIAVSDPFPLFTEEAIKQMRLEVLSKSVMENCQYSSNLANCQLRGFAPE